MTTRRTFITAVSAATIATLGTRRGHAAAGERIHLAHIGVGGKGWSDMLLTSRGHDVVAICDVDERALGKAASKFPHAKKYTDWRKMLQQKDIDAVTVSTPDHTHAPATLAALQLGKHAYTQKPLTHSVVESRQLTIAAKKAKVVTQMGIQHHSNTFFKTAAHLVQKGVIGKVSVAHVWTDRPVGFWKQGISRPKGSQDPPTYLHWNNWLGVAPKRPYVPNAYHRFHWRAYWDFGTGALGDMGCHGMDPVVHALKLGPPSELRADGPRPNEETGPVWSIVRYSFPGTEYTTKKVKLLWYDGNKRPNARLFKGPKSFSPPKNGILFEGSKGNLFVHYGGGPHLFPEDDFGSFKIEKIAANDHYQQWTNAILGKGKTSCAFSYSGPLSETVLLGNVAIRSGRTIQWNAKSMTAQADDGSVVGHLLRRKYRKF